MAELSVDWNPAYLYSELTPDKREIEKFLSDVCTPSWNHTLDLGRPWEEARAELVAKFPEQEKWIDLYWTRWLDMFKGPIHESVDILMDLKRKGYPLYALSNWNDEKFHVALKEFPFLNLFDGAVVSGFEKLAKPDPSIYKVLLARFDLNPRETLFIDDRPENVEAARNLGIEAVQFTSPYDLETHLISYGIYQDDDDKEADEEEAGCCGGSCTCHNR